MPVAFDIGAFDGADTAHYLSRGYRVVSVEADPTLGAKLRVRFAKEIAENRCFLLNVGIAPHEGTATFFVCDEQPLWNSFDRRHIEAHGGTVRPVEIPCRTFRSLIAEFGVPEFLKVDIEGLDHLCILGIPQDETPKYVSFEAGHDALALVLYLHSIGFASFRLVDQNGWTTVRSPDPGTPAHVRWSIRQLARFTLRRSGRLHHALAVLRDTHFRRLPDTFAESGSGPMPDEVAKEEWSDLAAFLYTYENIRRGGVLDSSWFDVHAAR